MVNDITILCSPLSQQSPALLSILHPPLTISVTKERITNTYLNIISTVVVAVVVDWVTVEVEVIAVVLMSTTIISRNSCKLEN